MVMNRLPNLIKTVKVLFKEIFFSLLGNKESPKLKMSNTKTSGDTFMIHFWVNISSECCKAYRKMGGLLFYIKFDRSDNQLITKITEWIKWIKYLITAFFNVNFYRAKNF